MIETLRVVGMRAEPPEIRPGQTAVLEALLLGVRHPAKVRKLVSMAANLNPSTKAIYEESDALLRQMLAEMPEAVRNTPEGKRATKVTSMMFKEPNIDPALLAKVSAPRRVTPR